MPVLFTFNFCQNDLRILFFLQKVDQTPRSIIQVCFLSQGTRTLACMGAQNCIDSHLDIFSFVLATAAATNKHVLMYLELNWILNLCQHQDKLVLSYLIASQTMALWQTQNWLSRTFSMPFYAHPDFPVQWLLKVKEISSSPNSNIDNQKFLMIF